MLSLREQLLRRGCSKLVTDNSVVACRDSCLLVAVGIPTQRTEVGYVGAQIAEDVTDKGIFVRDFQADEHERQVGREQHVLGTDAEPEGCQQAVADPERKVVGAAVTASSAGHHEVIVSHTASVSECHVEAIVHRTGSHDLTEVTVAGRVADDEVLGSGNAQSHSSEVEDTHNWLRVIQHHLRSQDTRFGPAIRSSEQDDCMVSGHRVTESHRHLPENICHVN